MNDDMTLEEIEDRLDELADEREQADALADSFGEAFDALDDIRQNDLVDGETAAKVLLLKTMLKHVRRCDADPHRGIYHQKDRLRKQRFEKCAEAEGC